MLEALHRLGGTNKAARAAPRRLALFLMARLPQQGQWPGMAKGLDPDARFSITTESTWGMTSPALWTITQSPTRISFSAI